MDDERFEQVLRGKEMLSDKQIEAVKEEVRKAADRGEELSFLDAAVRMCLLTDEQAAQACREADREVSTSETQDISEAIAAEEEPPAGHEAEQPAGREEGEAPEAGSGETAEADQAETTKASVASSEQGEARPAAEAGKPPYAAIAIGILVLVALVILAAILNR